MGIIKQIKNTIMINTTTHVGNGTEAGWTVEVGGEGVSSKNSLGRIIRKRRRPKPIHIYIFFIPLFT